MDFSRLAIIFGALAVIVVAAAVFLVFLSQRRSVKLPLEAVAVIGTSTGEIRVPVEIARTNAEKIQGLSDRESMSSDAGMIFVWDRNIKSGFSMRRMNFALDIIFVKDVGDGMAKIITIADNLSACPGKNAGCETAATTESFRYVLEVNAGFAAERGIDIGDIFSLTFSE